jgi:hypothetical protein
LNALRKIILTIIAYVVVVSAVLIGGFFFLNRPQLISIDADIPEQFPVDSFSHEAFEELLGRYVDSEGNIDYGAWHESTGDRALLDRYLAAVSRFSPAETPERFAKRSEQLAYWLYAYNAYVIRSVLENWPLQSVTDVKAPIEAVKGLGFFYRQRFLFGGDALSLYAVEHEKILATYRDPRIHFVLNCASASCPVLRPELPTGDDLEELLKVSTKDFIHDERNVRVDHDGQQVVLSTIFKWYRNDFINDVRRRGLPDDDGVLGYIRDVASADLQADLIKGSGYSVLYEDYDWAINQQEY